MKLPKDEFISNELFSLVIQAALGRSKTYKEKLTEVQHKAFRDGFHKILDSMVIEYEQPVSSDRHIENIRCLSDDVSAKYSEYLHENCFRIGSAQKALNLYLKYLWCLNKIPCPPHCPFDAIIINRLRPDETINWTEFDSIAIYKKLVDMAHKAANGEPIAEWELNEYNKNSN